MPGVGSYEVEQCVPQGGRWTIVCLADGACHRDRKGPLDPMAPFTSPARVRSLISGPRAFYAMLSSSPVHSRKLMAVACADGC